MANHTYRCLVKVRASAELTEEQLRQELWDLVKEKIKEPETKIVGFYMLRTEIKDANPGAEEKATAESADS